MRENLAIAKLYKLRMKSLAVVDLFRQVGSVTKAISITLICVVLLCQNFSTLAASRLVLPPIFCPWVPVSGRSTQPASWVYLLASEFQVISSFSSLREMILNL